jgi:hypothetical protein
MDTTRFLMRSSHSRPSPAPGVNVEKRPGDVGRLAYTCRGWRPFGIRENLGAYTTYLRRAVPIDGMFDTRPEHKLVE